MKTYCKRNVADIICVTTDMEHTVELSGGIRHRASLSWISREKIKIHSKIWPVIPARTHTRPHHLRPMTRTWASSSVSRSKILHKQKHAASSIVVENIFPAFYIQFYNLIVRIHASSRWKIRKPLALVRKGKPNARNSKHLLCSLLCSLLWYSIHTLYSGRKTGSDFTRKQ